jgi:hypothetical protein
MLHAADQEEAVVRAVNDTKINGTVAAIPPRAGGARGGGIAFLNSEACALLTGRLSPTIRGPEPH